MSVLRLARNCGIEAREMGVRFLVHHVPTRRHRRHTVAVKGLGPVVIRRGSTDGDVFAQIFAHKEYNLRRFGQFEAVEARVEQIAARGRRPLVVDLGANNGASALWFARMFPTARVVAVEPDQDNAAICALNTADYDVEVLPVAIGSVPGSVTLVSEDRENWAFTTVRDGAGSVPVTTVPDIVAAQGDEFELLLVKIDIEGFEEDLFAENTDWVRDATVIIVEPHDWMLPGGHTSRNFQRVLGADHFDVMILGENLIYVRSAEPSPSSPAVADAGSERPVMVR